MNPELAGVPHRRYNPLRDSWVLVSPQRDRRSWRGRHDAPPAAGRRSHDPDCCLCPGNARANGLENPRYPGVYVFDHDFPALLHDTPDLREDSDGLLVARTEPGVCRVVCFSPRHDLTLAEMTAGAIRRVVDVWVNQSRGLGLDPAVNHVQIFENKGAMMGCSNPHPHGQIWAQRSLPEEPALALRRMRAHYRRHGSTLLGDYLVLELTRGERVVCANDGFVALVPFWAVWPFETLVLCRRRVARLSDLDDSERDAFADILRRLTVRYDNLFETSVPYSSGIHQAPTDGQPHPEYDLHMHFYPPLLRSAAVRKFMAGYELLGEPQRDLTPETGAARLREQGERHFRANAGPDGD